MGKTPEQNGMTSWLDCVECHEAEDMAERVRARIVAQQEVEVSWHERCLQGKDRRNLLKKINRL